MDAGHFDRLVKSWLSLESGRRALLGVLASAPFLGGLAGLPGVEEDVVDAHGRRRRRVKRHKHGKGRRRKGKRKKRRCKPQSMAETCRGTCGLVANNCKKTVDCGACTCDASCSGTCCADLCVDLETDAANCGACGFDCPAGHTCKGGECRIPCGGTTCDPATEICVEDACKTCDVTCSAADHACSGEDLQDKLAGGDTIYVCRGRYAGGFEAKEDVTVIGAGDGGDERSNTILDGQNSQRVLRVGNGDTVSLARLRITGGAFPGKGAGIRNEGVLTMTACTVTANTATDGGGGGIHTLFQSSLTMVGCTVSNNTTTGDGGTRHGAGIAGDSYLTEITLTDCTISGNTSSEGAGGIDSMDTLTLNNCTFTGNDALDGNGGAIRHSGGTLTFNGGRVVGNYASGEGGGIYANTGTISITDVTFKDNERNNCAGSAVGTCS